ncbi:hypothetical protein PISL3812_03641 [Talaromyces islandicus]|uniref:Myb-like domain-containing protein n=1 Tax=Talaromyces islandicus TaxID=28573 RepID=A0A0U1LVE3_TALIS|nr:hypothetical protein PISL3812_03641 [Talaromyces islandicus]
MRHVSYPQHPTSPSLTPSGQDCDLAEITEGFINGGPLSFTPPLLEQSQSPQDYPEAGMSSIQHSPLQPEDAHRGHIASSQRSRLESGGANISSTWTVHDDAVLMQARAHSHGWGQIQKEHFPKKTANACRKRYERLVAKRRGPEWDQEKLERLSVEYNRLREQTWQTLAFAVGEKWQDVEKACFDRGLKSLTSPTRRAPSSGHALLQQSEITKTPVTQPHPRRVSALPLKDMLTHD